MNLEQIKKAAAIKIQKEKMIRNLTLTQWLDLAASLGLQGNERNAAAGMLAIREVMA